MGIFNKKVKITPESMGLVVCETARCRIESLIKDCKENNIEYKIAPLEIYTFTYNFFLIEKVLIKKHDKITVSKIIDSAFNNFYNMCEKSFDKNDMILIKKEIKIRYEVLEKIIEKQSMGTFDNYIRDITKLFIIDITGDDNSYLNEIHVMTIFINIVNWIKFSEFLLSDYKIKLN